MMHWRKHGTCLLFHLSIFSILSYNFVVRCDGIKYHFKPGATDNRQTIAEESAESKFHVKTPSCSIPVTNMLPEYYRKLYFDNETLQRKKQNIPDCRRDTKFAFLIRNNKVLKLDPHFTKGKTCSLHEIKRMENNDKNYTSIVHPLKKAYLHINVTKMEMFMTKCDEQSNYDARILLSPTVKNKMKFWEEEMKRLEKLEKLEEQRKQDSGAKPLSLSSSAIPTPINVLLLGFDSTSRSHFHRSLPKSVKKLNKLNFTDFRGFHTISPHTLYNLERLLFGTARDCSANIPYFDPCLFIWKDFNAMNFVTLYNEDGEGSLNTGSNEGFKFKPPTDFYLRPLFNALDSLRGTQGSCCASSETVPQFLLRYLSEFIQVFEKTPFFAFSYFNNPFHDEPPALADLDDDFEIFLEKSLTRKILEKTLVIITADHGERYGMFHEHSLESYLERSLPPLFIRVPENLKKKYPETDFDANLRHNSRRLSTALDIHQTILHTIILSAAETRIVPGKTKATPSFPVSLAWLKQKDVNQSHLMNFNVSLPDRSSLFLPLFSNRSCTTLDIDGDGTCVCNSTAIDDLTFLDDVDGQIQENGQEPQEASNPFLVQNLIIFAVDELNREIKIGEGEQWNGSCTEWSLNILPQISAVVVASGTEAAKTGETTGKSQHENKYQDILLKFRATTIRNGFGIDGKFQVKIRLNKNKNKREEREEKLGGNSALMKQMELQSVFSRLDEYKDQSWCIRPVKTKRDKQMKEMCVCKFDKAEYYDDG